MRMTTTLTRRTRWWRRFGAGVVAMVMASLAMFGASRASAADVGNPATIDPGATGTLNVNKRVNPTGTPTPGNGLEQANVTGDPLGGIEFVVKQIPGIDLTTQAGWDALAAMTVDQARTATQNVAGSSQTTNAAGLASFTGLALGGYLVQEKLTPEQLASGLTPSPDFVVTLPLTHPTDLNAWLYTVHVYPKNAKSSITKTVDDAAAKVLGDPVNWTILGDIPSTGATDRYVITDAFDSRLDYVSATVKLSKGQVALAPEDYVITPAQGTTALAVTFTPAGLAKLWQAKSADNSVQVQVDVSTKVAGDIGDGIILNDARLFPSMSVDPGDPQSGVSVADPPVTKWGNIEITKKDAGTTMLAGAQFRVYPTPPTPRPAPTG